jgi:hypothetical protein
LSLVSKNITDALNLYREGGISTWISMSRAYHLRNHQDSMEQQMMLLWLAKYDAYNYQ